MTKPCNCKGARLRRLNLRNIQLKALKVAAEFEKVQKEKEQETT